MSHTMSPIDQVKSLLRSGDTAGAEALCRKALEAAPDDARLSLYLATCRRLQGDEESFRRIMLELAPKMEALLREDPDCEAARLWRKAGAALMEYVVLGVLVITAATGFVIWSGKKIHNQFEAMTKALAGYRGPPVTILDVEPAGTNIVEVASVTNVASARLATITTNAVETAVDSAGEETP